MNHLGVDGGSNEYQLLQACLVHLLIAANNLNGDQLVRSELVTCTHHIGEHT